MSSVEIGDLIRALGRARATFVAHVGPGATTTTIPLADLDLGSANLSGNLVLLDAGALGAASPPTIATISSNTATSLTVPALSAAPAEGSTVWIFSVATIQVGASENITYVGGSPVPTDDSGNPRVPVTIYATHVFSATVPTGAYRLLTSGEEEGYYTLTVYGYYAVEGQLDCQSLTIETGGKVSVLPGGTIQMGIFM